MEPTLVLSVERIKVANANLDSGCRDGQNTLFSKISNLCCVVLCCVVCCVLLCCMMLL
jgi:hypothetical protein